MKDTVEKILEAEKRIEEAEKRARGEAEELVLKAKEKADEIIKKAGGEAKEKAAEIKLEAEKAAAEFLSRKSDDARAVAESLGEAGEKLKAKAAEEIVKKISE